MGGGFHGPSVSRGFHPASSACVVEVERRLRLGPKRPSPGAAPTSGRCPFLKIRKPPFNRRGRFYLVCRKTEIIPSRRNLSGLLLVMKSSRRLLVRGDRQPDLSRDCGLRDDGTLLADWEAGGVMDEVPQNVDGEELGPAAEPGARHICP